MSSTHLNPCTAVLVDSLEMLSNTLYSALQKQSNFVINLSAHGEKENC